MSKVPCDLYEKPANQERGAIQVEVKRDDANKAAAEELGWKYIGPAGSAQAPVEEEIPNAQRPE